MTSCVVCYIFDNLDVVRIVHYDASLVGVAYDISFYNRAFGRITHVKVNRLKL